MNVKTKLRARARRGHGRWSIASDPGQRLLVRCLCGDEFYGLLDWSRHAFADLPGSTGSQK